MNFVREVYRAYDFPHCLPILTYETDKESRDNKINYDHSLFLRTMLELFEIHFLKILKSSIYTEKKYG